MEDIQSLEVTGRQGYITASCWNLTASLWFHLKARGCKLESESKAILHDPLFQFVFTERLNGNLLEVTRNRVFTFGTESVWRLVSPCNALSVVVVNLIQYPVTSVVWLDFRVINSAFRWVTAAVVDWMDKFSTAPSSTKSCESHTMDLRSCTWCNWSQPCTAKMFSAIGTSPWNWYRIDWSMVGFHYL